MNVLQAKGVFMLVETLAMYLKVHVTGGCHVECYRSQVTCVLLKLGGQGKPRCLTRRIWAYEELEASL